MQHRKLPHITNPIGASSATCGTVFGHLNDALTLFDIGRRDFNSRQHQLISRFSAVCWNFGRDILAVDVDPNALDAVFGAPAAANPIGQNGMQVTARAVISAMCEETCDELKVISSSVQRALHEDLADVMVSLRDQQDEHLPYCEELDTLTSSVLCLADQVATVFDIQIHMLQRNQFVQLSDKGINGGGDTTCGVNVEEFMRVVKPPVRRPTVEERLRPYMPQLSLLRDSGYTYAQCAQYLRENGISINPAAVSNHFSQTRRTADPGKAESAEGSSRRQAVEGIGSRRAT